jgi:hypothetical protein
MTNIVRERGRRCVVKLMHIEGVSGGLRGSVTAGFEGHE